MNLSVSDLVPDERRPLGDLVARLKAPRPMIA